MPTWFLTKALKTYDGEKIALQLIFLGKLDIYMQKTETRSMSFILYKCEFKVDWGP
jgi:hypothetical protein